MGRPDPSERGRNHPTGIEAIMMKRITGALLAAMLLAPGPAGADHLLGNLPWTTLLPPRQGVPDPGVPAAPCGAVPTAGCVDGVIADMYAGWTPLDLSCDPRSVFALTYLRTTEAFRTTLETGFFDDEDAIIQLDRVFANLYFAAYDGYANGTAPPAWAIAFDAATHGRTNAAQDIYLGMNAHIQRDLPVALASIGLNRQDGSSRKPDHDRVNEILSGVLDGIQDEIAQRYDPLFTLFDAKPVPTDEMGSLELLKSWRELAWRNAERLLLAPTPAARAMVMAQIEAYSTAWARLLSAPNSGLYAARRLAYCRSQQQ